MTDPGLTAKGLHNGNVVVVDDAAALYRAAAEEFRRCARAAIAERGRFTVALSGGNTPRGVYSLLAQDSSALPWDKIYIFFGDERHVPPDDPQSNYRMAKESLFSKAPIPPQNVYRVPAELAADLAADEYERKLRDFFQLRGSAWPRLDLILLGIGEDGHTASLFPESPGLKEESRLVVANWVEKFSTNRITFTYPVLNNAAEVLFLVSGKGKAEILREILSSSGKQKYPAQAVRPVSGKLIWLVDRDAFGSPDPAKAGEGSLSSR